LRVIGLKGARDGDTESGDCRDHGGDTRLEENRCAPVSIGTLCVVGGRMDVVLRRVSVAASALGERLLRRFVGTEYVALVDRAAVLPSQFDELLDGRPVGKSLGREIPAQGGRTHGQCLGQLSLRRQAGCLGQRVE
jgi:hypothetical protein